ncbi:3'(2'),5'-bisphosphate nucleotidase [Cordyceps fumosorosea ARSEF 2679]|uniref:3'(2'),5'-bisphosphate nucleotidase n=1 Tax=Cordyceps fumosorosea (strain ARSEF 2679) TaxID=1081104 RepID=A0A167WIL1_CORFA|nr:3'(2'),5'-bisphosphate nucleotidase [Cordyceps fumosorosea ARSEF 2679]OAA63836.1 3'(2'),5'-bisphosphate nucleotidase [Cordyceps fumosorosea ARSEF 2679]
MPARPASALHPRETWAAYLHHRPLLVGIAFVIVPVLAALLSLWISYEEVPNETFPTKVQSPLPNPANPAILAAAAAIPSLFSPRRLAQLSGHLLRRAPSPSSSIATPPTVATMVVAPRYERELQVAELAVQRAAILTKRVFHEKAKGTVDKNDKSPVTIGDFGAQALIIAALRHNFPEDAIVAEEEAAQLREDAALRRTIWELVRSTSLADADAEALLGGAIPSVESMLDLIDQGASPGGKAGRIWTIDPIDGTKGFLRGGQYAVCLGLMIDGDVKVGVLGCPNLPVDDAARLTAESGASGQTDAEGHGVLLSAVQHHGAHSRALSAGGLAAPPAAIGMRPLTDLSAATFCESVEAAHSAHGDQANIAAALGITAPSVRMDSQAKYGSIARGAGDIYLRLPVKASYQEKIWDHAAGDLIVREAGGQVTDIHGRRLDFGAGRTLANNKGVVAAPASVHAQVLKAVQEVLKIEV